MPRPRPDAIDRHVGRAIRGRRTELDLTLESLAEELGITYQQLMKYEHGINRVSAGRLYAIAKALDCAPGDFFPPVAPAREHDLLAEFMALAAKLDEAGRERLMEDIRLRPSATQSS